MFKTENKKLFDTLFEKAQESEFIAHRHSSAIVYKGRVLAVECNQKRTHPLQKRFSRNENNIWLHSEIAAIVRVISLYGSTILKDCELYNLRLTGGGNIGISKPCASCQKAIDAFEIGSVLWT